MIHSLRTQAEHLLLLITGKSPVNEISPPRWKENRLAKAKHMLHVFATTVAKQQREADAKIAEKTNSHGVFIADLLRTAPLVTEAYESTTETQVMSHP